MANTDNFVQPAIPKFDGHFDHWSMLMENFLRSKEMWNLVDEGIPTAEGTGAVGDTQKKGVEDATHKKGVEEPNLKI
ncbi:unnamed protein product [Rhodiola kirilowii]